jgi:hypothetical protein
MGMGVHAFGGYTWTWACMHMMGTHAHVHNCMCVWGWVPIQDIISYGWAQWVGRVQV